MKLKLGYLMLGFILGLASLFMFDYIKTRSHTDYPQGIENWKGVYRAGFETQMFTPCGGKEGMWVEGKYQEIDDYISKTSNPTSTFYTTEVYVEIQGDVSPPGTYGHMDAFQQQINIVDIIKVQYGMPFGCN